MPGLRDRPLVERDDEQIVIEEAVEDARGGSSRLLLIDGLPGVGKTRLLLFARDLGRAAGFQVLAARGSELERSFAFGLVRGLFQPCIAGLSEGRRREVLSGQARMAVRPLGLEVGARRRPSGEALQATFNGLFWLSAALAQERPLLLAVDDVQWSDETSLRWLAFAAPRFEGLPVLMVLAHRQSEPGVDVSGLIFELSRLERADVLAPQPLSRDAVKLLVGNAFASTPKPVFVDACYEATKGNPFLLHELLRELEAARIDLQSGRGAECIARLGSTRVSESVFSRVRKLGDDAVRLTRAAAVLGDRARLIHAAALAGLDEERAMRVAAMLVDADVLAEGFPLEFVHPLVRSAIYEHLPYAERLEAHGCAARILADDGEPAETIAAHLLILPAMRDSWVVDLLRRAAEDAAGAGAPNDAITYLRRALVEPPSEETRASVLAELGMAEHNAEDEAAIEHLSQALEAVEEPSERAEVGLILARAIWHQGRIVDAVKLLEELVDELDERLTEDLEAELVAIARLDPRTRKVGLARLAQYERRGAKSPAGRRLLQANLCFERAVSGQGSADEIARLGVSALADGLLLAEEGSENTIHHLAAWALAQCDRFEDAEVALQAAIESARHDGSAAGCARALTFRVNLCYRRGLLDEAEADAKQALEHLTPVRAPLAVAFLLDVLIERDELRAAEDLLEQYGLSGELPESVLHTFVLERRGRLRLAEGKADQALTDLMACRRRALKWGAGSPAFLAWRSSAAQALAQTGRTRDALALASEECERAEEFGAARALGIALRTQSLLANDGDAIGLLRKAVEVTRGSGAELEHARVLVDLGTAAQRAGQRATARRHLRTGLELAERHAARALARRARTELRGAGGRPGREGRTGVEALTPAERRVARMAAEGMSNREIAEALFVIPKTVEWHLGQTYRKLGATSRTELRELLPPNGPDRTEIEDASS